MDGFVDCWLVLVLVWVVGWELFLLLCGWLARGLVVLVCMICLCLLCELLCVSFLIVCCYSSVCVDFGCCFAVGIGLLLDCG